MPTHEQSKKAASPGTSKKPSTAQKQREAEADQAADWFLEGLRRGSKLDLPTP